MVGWWCGGVFGMYVVVGWVDGWVVFEGFSG